MALDGKTLRGSTKQGAPGTHLYSALTHHVGVTLAHHAVDDKTKEITAVETLLCQVVWEGRIVTLDALLTQRHVAQTIGDKGGDSVRIVTDHQPQRRACMRYGALSAIAVLPTPVGSDTRAGSASCSVQ
jgi:hypothetical protein